MTVGMGWGASLALDATSPRASLLGSMQEVGLIQSFGAAVGASTEWALARQGVASLRPCVELAEPLPVCRIRECAPRCKTTSELVLQLRRDGWVWKKLPLAVRERANLWSVCDDHIACEKPITRWVILWSGLT